MKKLTCIALVLVMLFGMLAACDDGETNQLAAPTGVTMTAEGLIKWNPVDGATSYEVKIGNNIYTVTNPSYQVTNLNVDFTYTIVACAEGKEKSEPSAPKTHLADRTPAVKLPAPDGLTMTSSGLITWNAVAGANAYIIYINNVANTVTTPSYQVNDLAEDFNYYVVACGKDALNSDASVLQNYVVNTAPAITVTVNGAEELRSGHETKLTAQVNGTSDTTVLWEVVSGGEYVTINEFTGVLQAKSDLTQSVAVEVRAVSLADESCYGSFVVTLITPPALTQAMLDAAAAESVIEFGGYVNISLYEFGLKDDFYMSSVTNIKTATDGTSWYAEYVNGNTGLTEYLYYKNDKGITSQVGVSLMNEEEYFPMLDDRGNTITWQNSGFYNNFKGLTVADFRFNEETWKYEYAGADTTLAQRMVACANPYDFDVQTLGLIVEEGEIIGITALAKDDYTIVTGYRAVQEMVVTMNYGETVEVPTIGKFKTEDWHAPLKEAIENMQNLESYKVDYMSVTQTMGLTPDYTGFEEIITSDHCYYEPYVWDLNTQMKNFTGANYGNKQINENLYNTYFADGENGYYATRAYAGSVDEAKPTFAFAPEIFTAYSHDEENGYDIYYVNQAMCSVATTFYHGIGNDIALYGIFATDYIYVSGQTYYTPYVVVKDGYIIETGFYFDIIQISGHIVVSYSDFGTATMPEGVDVSFTPRQLPTSWSELTVQVLGGNDGNGDVEVNAMAYFTELFESAETAAEVPFFGDVLGDSYAVGMTTIRMPASSNVAKHSVALYYDVPLDADSTINSSLEKLDDFLTGLGYTRNRYGEYEKGEIVVVPTDTSLDLFIYVWRK